MARLNVYLPDELAELVRDRLPGVNVSQVLRGALSALLECHHVRAVCADCALPLDVHERIGEALTGFYRQALWDLHELVTRGGTAEGAARVLRSTAQRWPVPGADRIPLPRPTRAERVHHKVRELPARQPRRATA